VNPSFTWGYHIITENATLTGQRLEVSRHMLGLQSDALQQFEMQWNQLAHENTDISTILAHIRQVIIQAAWNNGPVGAFQSPLKRHDSSWKGWKGNVKLRNYLFVLAAVPRNGDDLMQALNMQDLGLKKLLHTFNYRLFSEEMWIDLMKERIGLSWIDISSQTKSKEVETD
jgi:hypothetical protein